MDVDVDLIGCIGVGLGGSYGCRCGMLYAPMLGVVFYAGLVSLTFSSFPSPCSPYSSELVVWVFHVHVVRPHVSCANVHPFKIYREFRNVLRDYKNLF